MSLYGIVLGYRYALLLEMYGDKPALNFLNIFSIVIIVLKAMPGL
jgi:hypothetical protein